MYYRVVGLWAWRVDALLLILVTGGLVWAVAAGERELAAYLAMGAWVLLLGLVAFRNTPETAAWILAVIAAAYGASAIAFFRLYQWAGWLVMAYIDAISTGLVSLQAVVNLLLKGSRSGSGPGDAEGRGEPPAVGQD